MAASHDSQGLKIAVAAFVSLSVILSVTSYFLYSSYAQSEARLTLAQDEKNKSQKAASDALTQFEDLRKFVGAHEGTDIEGIKAEVKKENTKIDEVVTGSVEQVKQAVAKAQAAGASGPELEQANATAQQLVAAYHSEPNKNYISSLDRLANLLRNQSLLSTSLAVNYVDVKRNLESANSVNQSKLGVETDALGKAKTDLEAEHKKHEQERATLLAKVDQYQTAMNTQATEIQNLNNRLRQLEEDYGKKLAQAQTSLREAREKGERTETVLDSPDGRVTFVDYFRGELRTNLSRAMGARPQMKFSIFDAGSPGIPTERPKGTIELTYVGDNYSIGRIEKTFSNIDPIRTGDIVYSPSWSPNEPMRFALIGKIDVNRDGKDDRDDLKRMIEASGGIVDYDLPQPTVGKETGKLTGRDAWYVIDERPPFRDPKQTSRDITLGEDKDFLEKKTAAIREARLNGVRPIDIGRLLAYLGYDFAAPIRGRSEGVNRNALQPLLRSRVEEAKAKAEAAAKEAAPGAGGAAPDAAQPAPAAEPAAAPEPEKAKEQDKPAKPE